MSIMKRIKISTSCPKTLIKKINVYLKKGYYTDSNPSVLFDFSTKKVSYHQFLYKK